MRKVLRPEYRLLRAPGRASRWSSNRASAALSCRSAPAPARNPSRMKPDMYPDFIESCKIIGEIGCLKEGEKVCIMGDRRIEADVIYA